MNHSRSTRLANRWLDKAFQRGVIIANGLASGIHAELKDIANGRHRRGCTRLFWTMHSTQDFSLALPVPDTAICTVEDMSVYRYVHRRRIAFLIGKLADDVIATF